MAGGASRFVHERRVWLAALAAFGLGYLAGAKGPTPPLSRFAPETEPAETAGPITAPHIATPTPLPPVVKPAASSTTSNGPSASDFAALHATLLRVRTKLELYALQHGDRRPTLAQLQHDWSSLIACTDAEGRVADPGPLAWGPYLDARPMNPVVSSAAVAAAGRAVAGAGWTYDEKTGELRAVLPYGVKWPPLEKAGVERVAAKPLTASADVVRTP